VHLPTLSKDEPTTEPVASTVQEPVVRLAKKTDSVEELAPEPA
jgi:hypothetical protein